MTNASSSRPRYWSGSVTVSPFDPIRYGFVLLIDPIGPLPCATVTPSTWTPTVLPARVHTTWCHDPSAGITAVSVNTCTAPDEPENRQLSLAAPDAVCVESFHCWSAQFPFCMTFQSPTPRVSAIRAPNEKSYVPGLRVARSGVETTLRPKKSR